ncbi:MAG: recombinase family protein [Coriobacteriia bacterium]|nr:recombinase family protein [Coriobacteriia bacterium]
MSASCVIYARVSTKEQQDEGYSLDTQQKALYAFCEAQGLAPVAEFVAAESASKPGREVFARMLAFLRAHREVRSVVVMRLDRLSRNWSDKAALEELGVRVRCVEGDASDTPEGLFFADMLQSQAVYYSRDLSRKVGKGMGEKVAQGGWPHRAPMGYINDKNTRSVVPDPLTAPLVVWAFERYSSGAVALSTLADELAAKGLVRKDGKKLGTSTLNHILANPFYCGRLPYKGEVYPGAHSPLITVRLFDEVQARLTGNRNGTKGHAKVFSLRGAMRCQECGCLITAGEAKGHTYYRCTHGKGKGSCSQSAYIREEVLLAQVEEILGSIEIGPDVLEALVADCEALLEEKRAEIAPDISAAQSELAGLKAKERKLLDAYLDGTVPSEIYTERAQELQAIQQGLLLRIAEAGRDELDPIAQVRDVASRASSARITFQGADETDRLEVLNSVLCYLGVQDGHIASYQYKSPFGLLEMEPSGAFKNSWWAIEDLNL